MHPEHQSNSHAAPSLWTMIKSVGAAALGVQSDKNRQRDFSKGSLPAFIVLGLIGTILFVLTVYGVVRLVLSIAAV